MRKRGGCCWRPCGHRRRKTRRSEWRPGTGSPLSRLIGTNRASCDLLAVPERFMRTVVLEHRFMSVRYEDLGTGIPVVLLHAFPLDRGMWEPQLGPIAAAGFRVLAPDLPEFGETTPGSEVFAIERSADVVADLLE